ncbi:hypothetical protein BX600DRAFT_515031 [Xylariales sp. PMI_506]|nr:hypothetical protein BX600DRAFT_515031 [Xylariales sp. PMI_506]
MAEARFGQEQVPVAAVAALSNFGSPGQAATLAGGIPGSLLAAADPCAKLTLADQIVSTLGTDPAVISAAAALVGAEQNFNPFVVSIPNICADASLPATESLRGIVPLVDPAVGGSDVENANQASSLKTPFSATGLSVAQVMVANGFSNFSASGVDQSTGSTGSAAGTAAAAAAADTTTAAAASSSACVVARHHNGQTHTTTTACVVARHHNGKTKTATTSSTSTTAVAAVAAASGCIAARHHNGNTGTTTTAAAAANAATSTADCAAATTLVTSVTAAAATTSTATAATAATATAAAAVAGAGAIDDPVIGTFPGFQASSLGLDFGTCTPTVKFEDALDGRTEGEFTFQAQDPVVNKGQEEALNPAIIFNRICDQLVNVCGASTDAHAACTAAQAQLGGGAKNASTADAWNTQLGFAGTNINPDGAPKAGLVGHS